MTLPARLAPKGPLLTYLEALAGNAALAPRVAETTETIRATLRTPGGQALLDLLDRATCDWGFDPSLGAAPEVPALADLKAQPLIAHDLRSLASDELEQVEASLERARSARRQPSRRTRSGG